MTPTPNARPASPEAYYAALPQDQRAALLALRGQILAAAPGATEVISYGMPGFRLGKLLVWIGAAKDHCALYPGGRVEDWADQLEGYSISKGTIRFRPERPIPEAVVVGIVARRMGEVGG